MILVTHDSDWGFNFWINAIKTFNNSFHWRLSNWCNPNLTTISSLVISCHVVAVLSLSSMNSTQIHLSTFFRMHHILRWREPDKLCAKIIMMQIMASRQSDHSEESSRNWESLGRWWRGCITFDAPSDEKSSCITLHLLVTFASWILMKHSQRTKSFSNDMDMLQRVKLP